MICLEKAVLPAILSLTKESDWRVRKSILSTVLSIASSLGLKMSTGGTLPFLQSIEFVDLVEMWLVDPVSEMRDYAIQGLVSLIRNIPDGSAWFTTYILGNYRLLDRIASSKSTYLHRRTVLKLLTALAVTLSSTGDSTFVKSCVQPSMEMAIKDPVGNIRSIAASSIIALGPATFGQSSYDAMLAVLRQDDDPVVQEILSNLQ